VKVILLLELCACNFPYFLHDTLFNSLLFDYTGWLGRLENWNYGHGRHNDELSLPLLM
jgi:hypothetical protein